MRYDPESNLVSIELAKGTIDHCVVMGKFLIHVNKQKTPLLIEVLDGGNFIAQLQKIKSADALPALPVAGQSLAP